MNCLILLFWIELVSWLNFKSLNRKWLTLMVLYCTFTRIVGRDGFIVQGIMSNHFQLSDYLYGSHPKPANRWMYKVLLLVLAFGDISSSYPTEPHPMRFCVSSYFYKHHLIICWHPCVHVVGCNKLPSQLYGLVVFLKSSCKYHTKYWTNLFVHPIGGTGNG